jgi:L-fuculose-phosphate aldolase
MASGFVVARILGRNEILGQTLGLSKRELLARAREQMETEGSRPSRTLRQRVALACRILFDNGHDSGLAGQITARGEKAGTFITQEFGVGFEETTASNLILVDEDLSTLEGDAMPNPANRFHVWLYRTHPEVNCIIHTHAFHTATLSMLETPLVISHMDTCGLFQDCAFMQEWPGLPFGNEEGQLISSQLGDKRAILLAHHGLLVATRSIEESSFLALQFERAARMQLLASAVGRICEIAADRAREAHDWLLSEEKRGLIFEYLARRALKQHSDCLS